MNDSAEEIETKHAGGLVAESALNEKSVSDFPPYYLTLSIYLTLSVICCLAVMRIVNADLAVRAESEQLDRKRAATLDSLQREIDLLAESNEASRRMLNHTIALRGATSVSETVPLPAKNYQEIKSVENALNKLFEDGKTGGAVRAIPGTNEILITGNETEISEIKEILAGLYASPDHR